MLLFVAFFPLKLIGLMEYMRLISVIERLFVGVAVHWPEDTEMGPRLSVAC